MSKHAMRLSIEIISIQDNQFSGKYKPYIKANTDLSKHLLKIYIHIFLIKKCAFLTK